LFIFIKKYLTSLNKEIYIKRSIWDKKIVNYSLIIFSAIVSNSIIIRFNTILNLCYRFPNSASLFVINKKILKSNQFLNGSNTISIMHYKKISFAIHCTRTSRI